MVSVFTGIGADMKIDFWRGLPYWKTGEWQAVDEKLKDLDKKKISWCPGRKNLFKALELTPLEEVRCCILGQDPYPDPTLATGLAFDVGGAKIPPSLKTMLEELKDDLGIKHGGNLQPWARQGVLLWNSVPSCEEGRSLSHDWCEWELLTIDILQSIQRRNVPIVFVGKHAQRFMAQCDDDLSVLIYVGHPSPRAFRSATPFSGSRIFSTLNDHISFIGLEPIDWSK